MGVHVPAGDGAIPDVPPTTSEPAAAQIDLDDLAERVFRLIKQQARLERERLGRPHSRPRQVHHGQ